MIKTPAEMTLGQRIMLTILIVIIILFALAAYGYFSGGWDKADAAPKSSEDIMRMLYQGIPFDEKLLQLDKRALDEAYNAQILRLWHVLLTDGAKEFDRFKNGLRITRETYTAAANEITRREKELGK